MASDQMYMDWLSGPVLTELLTATDVKGGLPRPLPAGFYQHSDTTVVGVNVEYDAVSEARHSSKLVDANSPSKRVETPGRSRKYAISLGTRENLGLDAEMIAMLQSNVPILQARAKRLQMQRALDFKRRVDNLQVNLVHSVLSQGKIWVDTNGEILPTSSGAAITVDFAQTYMGSGQLSKTSVWPNTTVQVGDWSIPSTAIDQSLRALGDAYAYTTGRQVGGVFVGRNIPTYFTTNTSMQTYMSRNPVIGREFADTNEIPAGMMDYSWAPAHRAFSVSSGNAITPWFDPDTITIVPALSSDWYENLECSLPVPSGIPFANSFEGLNDFAGMFPLTKGYGAYCYGSLDPISLTCVQQWYGLPVAKSPLIWQAKVK